MTLCTVIGMTMGEKAFGWYLQQCPGAFFGIGAGPDCPALHTSRYEYPDALLEPAAEAFLQLILA